MKKSQFKELIKEAMLEILPDIMEIMSESLNENLTVTQASKPDLTLVRQHAAKAKSKGPAYDLEDGTRFATNPSPSVATPNNPKGIVDGEVYASGQGLMEWYRKAGGKAAPAREFKHTDDDMDAFLSKKFGVK